MKSRKVEVRKALKSLSKFFSQVAACFILSPSMLWLITLGSFFGAVSLILFRAGLGTCTSGCCSRASHTIFEFVRRGYYTGRFGAPMHILEFVGAKASFAVSAIPKDLKDALCGIPLVGSIISDVLKSKHDFGAIGRLRAFVSWLIGLEGRILSPPISALEIDALLGLKIFTRLFFIGLGVLCNLIQLQHYSLLLSKSSASSAIAFNFAGQLIVAGIFSFASKNETPSFTWMLGAIVIVIGVICVAEEDDTPKDKN